MDLDKILGPVIKETKRLELYNEEQAGWEQEQWEREQDNLRWEEENG